MYDAAWHVHCLSLGTTNENRKSPPAELASLLSFGALTVAVDSLPRSPARAAAGALGQRRSSILRKWCSSLKVTGTLEAGPADAYALAIAEDCHRGLPMIVAPHFPERTTSRWVASLKLGTLTVPDTVHPGQTRNAFSSSCFTVAAVAGSASVMVPVSCPEVAE